MLQYIVRRVLTSIPTVLLTATITFSLIHLVPGNPVRIILGLRATPTEVQALSRQLHLNLPLPVQYVDWMGSVFTGHLGTSLIYHQPVAALILHALPHTAELTLVTFVLSLIIGIPLGMVSGLTRRRHGDQAITSFSTLGAVVPGFVWGLLLIYFFVFRWHLTNITGIAYDTSVAWLPPVAYLLPAVSLVFGLSAPLIQVLRVESREVARSDYIRTARMMGLSEFRIAIHGVFKNAFIPVVTFLGTQMGLLLSGVVIIENIYSIPGLGNLLVNAVFNRDYPVIMGTVFVLGMIVILVNLLVDLTYGLLDPRISYQ